jgi:hypothetical protein
MTVRPFAKSSETKECRRSYGWKAVEAVDRQQVFVI